jgi:hypothetical protein
MPNPRPTANPRLHHHAETKTQAHRQPKRHQKINRGEGRAMENKEGDESYGEQREENREENGEKCEEREKIRENERERKKKRFI